MFVLSSDLALDEQDGGWMDGWMFVLDILLLLHRGRGSGSCLRINQRKPGNDPESHAKPLQGTHTIHTHIQITEVQVFIRNTGSIKGGKVRMIPHDLWAIWQIQFFFGDFRVKSHNDTVPLCYPSYNHSDLNVDVYKDSAKGQFFFSL